MLSKPRERMCSVLQERRHGRFQKSGSPWRWRCLFTSSDPSPSSTSMSTLRRKQTSNGSVNYKSLNPSSHSAGDGGCSSCEEQPNNRLQVAKVSTGVCFFFADFFFSHRIALDLQSPLIFQKFCFRLALEDEPNRSRRGAEAPQWRHFHRRRLFPWIRILRKEVFARKMCKRTGVRRDEPAVHRRDLFMMPLGEVVLAVL